MNYTDDVKMAVEEFSFIFKKAMHECSLRGVDLTFLYNNPDTDEFYNMIQDTFLEEIQLCKEVTGRVPSYDEMISIMIERITDYSKNQNCT